MNLIRWWGRTAWSGPTTIRLTWDWIPGGGGRALERALRQGEGRDPGRQRCGGAEIHRIKASDKGMRRWTDKIREGLEQLRGSDQLLLVLSLVIGALVGLVVVAFILLTGRLAARMYPPGGAGWRRILVPVLGSLSTGYLLWRYFPFARGSGIPQTKFALFVNDGRISVPHRGRKVLLLLGVARQRYRARPRRPFGAGGRGHRVRGRAQLGLTPSR